MLALQSLVEHGVCANGSPRIDALRLGIAYRGFQVLSLLGSELAAVAGMRVHRRYGDGWPVEPELPHCLMHTAQHVEDTFTGCVVDRLP